MRKKIVCMGSVNMDLCMYMQIMPNVGETIRTDNFATYPGGKAGNQAAAESWAAMYACWRAWETMPSAPSLPMS